jgi:hypothetical protein
MHARYPALLAADESRKNTTFSRRGRRDAHPGRQYTPVVFTAKIKSPEAPRSRSATARHIAFVPRIVAMEVMIQA